MRRKRLLRLWCAIVGHKPYRNNLFSGRNRICQRCGHFPKPEKAT